MATNDNAFQTGLVGNGLVRVRVALTHSRTVTYRFFGRHTPDVTAEKCLGIIHDVVMKPREDGSCLVVV